jgi:hypothetical protein
MLYTYQRFTLHTRPAAPQTAVQMAEMNTVNAARSSYVDCKNLRSTADKDDNVQKQSQVIEIQLYFINCTKTLSVHSLKHVHMIRKKETMHQQPQRTTLAAH